MGIYDILEENLVDGSGVDMYLGCQPMVCLALAAEFIANKVTYMYLHSGHYLCA